MRDSWLFPHRPFDVAGFLRRIGSPRLRDMPGLAGWIDEAARQYDLRAEWLIGLAQKEQSAITAGSVSQHGQDWLMGYGYTEGPVYGQYRGARNQVFSAARGLRRYLTPGDGLYVGGRVGREWKDLEGISGRVGSLVEAVCLQYTPHWSTLQTVARIWRRFGFEDGAEMRPLAEVARTAKSADWMKASYAVKDGQRRYLTTARGYCAAWAGETLAHAFNPEAGANARHRQTTFRYSGIGDTADGWGDYLAVGGDRDLGAWIGYPHREQLRPGDMLFWRNGVRGYPYAPGHVAIVVSVGSTILVSENSSSRGIGVHGIDAAALGQVAGLKRWALPEEDSGIIIVEGLGPRPERVVRDAQAEVEGDTLRADVRPLLEGLGYRVIADHLGDQGKLYVVRE